MTALPATTWLPLLQEALAREGRFRFPLRGTSMRPTLPPACEIEIASLPARVPLGSLLVFASGDALVAHRLVRRIALKTGKHPFGLSFRTKGCSATSSPAVAARPACPSVPQSTGTRWIAHGDGRLAPDRPLCPEQALGLVTAAYRDGRRIWPGPAEALLRWGWIARHHALRPARHAWHTLRALACKAKAGKHE